MDGGMIATSFGVEGIGYGHGGEQCTCGWVFVSFGRIAQYYVFEVLDCGNT